MHIQIYEDRVYIYIYIHTYRHTYLWLVGMTNHFELHYELGQTSWRFHCMGDNKC